MKKFLFILSFILTTLFAHKALAQWEYFSDDPDGYYNNLDLTELDNGYFASIGWRGSPPWGIAPFSRYLTVLDTAGQEVFTRIFEEEENVYLANVFPAENGLYLIGFKKIDSLSSNYVYASKLDYDNQIVWESTFNQIASGTGKGLDGILLADTVISIIFPEKNEVEGNIDSTTLLKIALDGTLLSSVGVQATEFDLNRAMALAEDGNLLITGRNNDSLYLQKIDMEGNQIWKSIFGKVVSSIVRPLEGRKIIIADDGQIILMSWQNDFQGWGGTQGKTIFMKIDNDGNLIWEHTYFIAPNTEAYDFCKTDDGGFLLVGELGFDDVGSPKMFMLKADSNGIEQWRKDYIFTQDDVGFYALGRSVVNVGDDDVVLAAKEDSQNLYVIKINVADEVVTTKTPRLSPSSKISLSPIPTQSILNIELELYEKTELKIEVVNALGQVVDDIQTAPVYSEGIHRFNLNTDALQSGVYQVWVHTNKGSITKTFIKAK